MKFLAPENALLFDALRAAAPDSSNTTVRSWLKEGRVTVDNLEVKVGKTPIQKGQAIAVTRRSRYIEGDIKILFEDKQVVVIEKPEGLLSVATAFEKEKTAHAFLKKWFYPGKVYVVHRLDQATSGVMLFALSEKAQEKLKKDFEKHAIKREYAAIVEGHLSTKSGTWSSHLFEDGNYFVHTTNDTSKGHLATTHYKVLGKSKKHSWVNFTLETGKKNQIRVQSKDAGHPVVGDKKYGAKSDPINRLCLHALHLSFNHPTTDKIMRFDSPVPESFYRIVEKNHA